MDKEGKKYFQIFGNKTMMIARYKDIKISIFH